MTLVICVNITIREIDDRIYRQFKMEVVRDGTKIGNALTMAMKMWLDYMRKNKQTKKSILEVKPSDWGKGNENASVEVDRTLYGG